MMKTSNKILIGVFFLFFGLYLYNIYMIARDATPKVKDEEMLELEHFVAVKDTIKVEPFHYISSDAVQVTIDTGQLQVILETYEEFLPYCSIEVRKDTLFISKNPKLPSNDGQWVNVVVKAPRIKGLAVSNNGKILSANPITGLHSDYLSIWAGLGSIIVSVNTTTLDLHFHSHGVVMLHGSVDRLNIYGDESLARFYGYDLKVDSAYVYDLGLNNYQLHVNDYLYANLLNSHGDLAYRGHPTVVKKENTSGRVINANREVK